MLYYFILLQAEPDARNVSMGNGDRIKKSGQVLVAVFVVIQNWCAKCSAIRKILFLWKGFYEMHILQWDVTLNCRNFVLVLVGNTKRY